MNKEDCPKVSIITPSYNQAQFLENTILSVLNQDYPNIEYIIIDGASTDGSIDIIRKYKQSLAYWVSEPDFGQSHAINKGFQRATGDILAWLNSDDEYKQIDTISTVVQTFLKHQDIDMVYGKCDIVDENGNIKGHIKSFQGDLSTLLLVNNIPQPSAFFKQSVIEKIGFLDESLKYAMDYDFWLKISSSFKIKYLPFTLASFRDHTSSKTASQYDFFWIEKFTILRIFLLNTSLQRILQEKAYSHMLQLIVYEQKGQIEMVLECLQQINGIKLLNYEDIQNLCLFFNGQALTKNDINRVKINLFQLYRAFSRKYLNSNNNAVDKYAYHWTNKQMIFSVHYLYDQGKTERSKIIFWILIKKNPNILKYQSTYKLIIKYILPQSGIELLVKVKEKYIKLTFNNKTSVSRIR
ncbi:MAG: glycosyltransferase family 2 protein [Methanosarcinales archaeon]|nr:glycosyltransferase family 2 protein [Methanosarcinales archaeon]